MFTELLFAVRNSPLLIVPVVLFGFIGFGIAYKLLSLVWRGEDSKPRLAVEVAMGLGFSLVVSHLIFGNVGDVRDVHWLAGPEGPRVAVVYERKGKHAACRIRTTALGTGERVSQCEVVVNGSCDPSYTFGGIAWYEGYTSGAFHGDKTGIAVDLYSGTVKTDVASALAGADFRLAWSKSAFGAAAVRLQSSEVVFISPDGVVIHGAPAASASKVTDAPILPGESVSDTAGRFRALRFRSPCTAEGVELVRYENTAFGASQTHLAAIGPTGVVHWDVSWSELAGPTEPLLGVVGAERCIVVGGGSAPRAISLDGRTGKVLAKYAL